MKCYFFIIVFYAIFFMFTTIVVEAEFVFQDAIIFNSASSDKYVVYEHEFSENNNMHYVSIYNFQTGESYRILSNNGDYINSDMYFPSVSKNGKYLVFTSRADNITDDVIDKCLDISDNTLKNCSNIYLYDVDKKKSTLIKYGDSNFNGDNYVSKISANGNYIVFESISTNLLYDKYYCEELNSISNCINIYKYNLLSNSVSLVSTGNNNYGGNSNSVSPSISGDGRYITFQSNSTNLVSNIKYSKNCLNYLTGESEYCSNVYLIDTLNTSIKIISENDNELLPNNSGNAIVSGNGEFVFFESYTGINNNDISVVYLYNTRDDSINIITKNDNVLYNRDSYLQDLSYDGEYVVFKTLSTNIDSKYVNGNIYVYSVATKKTSSITNEKINVSCVVGNNIVMLSNDNKLIVSKLDSYAPFIEKNQIIYALYDNILSVKNKIDIIDNLSDRENIDVYIDNIEILKDIGEHIINVTAIDEFNNISTESVKIVIVDVDNEAPIFDSVDEINILKGSSNLNLNNHVRAVDKIDGETKIYIIDDGGLNLKEPGSYRIKLMSKDNADNISYKDIYVIVYDNYNFQYLYEILLILMLLGIIIFSIIKVK